MHAGCLAGTLSCRGEDLALPHSSGPAYVQSGPCRIDLVEDSGVFDGLAETLSGVAMTMPH